MGTSPGPEPALGRRASRQPVEGERGSRDAQPLRGDAVIDVRPDAFDVQLMYFPQAVTLEMGGTLTVPGPPPPADQRVRHQPLPEPARPGPAGLPGRGGGVSAPRPLAWGRRNDSDAMRYMFKISTTRRWPQRWTRCFPWYESATVGWSGTTATCCGGCRAGAAAAGAGPLYLATSALGPPVVGWSLYDGRGRTSPTAGDSDEEEGWGQAPDLALVPDVEADRREQHQALDDLLVVGADADELHAVVEHAEHQAADDRAEHGAHAAAHRGAADERGGDGLEFEVDAGLRRRRR